VIFIYINIFYNAFFDTKYSDSARRFMDQNHKLVTCISLVPVNDDMNQWRETMINYRILPYDALIASTCYRNGIKKIASLDRDFRRVDFLEVVEL